MENLVYTLLGLFFLTFDEQGKLSHQGQVVGEAMNGYYIVQWFDWIIGEPGDIMLIPVKALWERGCIFYQTADEWREGAAEHRGKVRRVPREKEA